MKRTWECDKFLAKNFDQLPKYILVSVPRCSPTGELLSRKTTSWKIEYCTQSIFYRKIVLIVLSGFTQINDLSILVDTWDYWSVLDLLSFDQCDFKNDPAYNHAVLFRACRGIRILLVGHQRRTGTWVGAIICVLTPVYWFIYFHELARLLIHAYIKR